MAASRTGSLGALQSAGDILYLDGSGRVERLGVGSNGQVLTLAAGLPTWAPAGGGGSVDLQGAYDLGSAIVVEASTNGSVSIAGTNGDETDELLDLDATDVNDGVGIRIVNGGTASDYAILLGNDSSGTNIISAFQAAAASNDSGGSLRLVGGDGDGTGLGGGVTILGGTAGDTATPSVLGGGSITLQGGVGGATQGVGGTVTINAGPAVAGNGGALNLSGGNGGGASGAAGDVSIDGGDSGSGSNLIGGDVALDGGAGDGSGDGGRVLLTGGTAGVTGDGGAIQLLGAQGGATSGAGGAVLVTAGPGAAGTMGTGGAITITAGGGGTGGASVGGDVTVTAGASEGAAVAGDVAIAAGGANGAGGTAGSVSLTGGLSNTDSGGGISLVTQNSQTGTPGAIALTAGGVTDGGASTDAADITLTPGTNAGAGRDGYVHVVQPSVFNPALQITGDADPASDAAANIHLVPTQTPWITRITAQGNNGTDENGSSIQVYAGSGNGTADGGAVVLTGGAADTDGAATGDGGNSVIVGGAGPGGTGGGGDVILLGGDGGVTAGDGGNITLTPGSPSGGGNNGFVQVVDSAFVPGQLTTAERNALVGTPDGAIVWNTSAGSLQYWDGATWSGFGGGGGSATLQDAYDNGSSIVVEASTNGPVSIAGTNSDETDYLLEMDATETNIGGLRILKPTAGLSDIAIQLDDGGGTGNVIAALDAVAASGDAGQGVIVRGGGGDGAGVGGGGALLGGAGGATGNGGIVSIFAGDGGSTSGNGGLVQIAAADAPTSGDGGALTLASGDGAGASGAAGGISVDAGNSGSGSGLAGGAIGLTAGSGDGAGDGGGVTLTGGASGASGAGGGVTLAAGVGADGGDITLNAGAAGVAAGTGGGIEADAGDGFGGGNGGAITFEAGNGDGAGNGGSATYEGGNGGTTGNGGNLNLGGGGGGATSGDGGNVTIDGGNAFGGTSDGGDITLTPGSGAGAGTDGSVTLSADFDVSTFPVYDIGGTLHFATTQSPWVAGITASSNGTNQPGTQLICIAGEGDGTGNGGAFQIFGGHADPTGTGIGGAITLRGGSGPSSGSGDGGDIAVQGGDGGGTSGAGGRTAIAGGAAATDSDGGDLALAGGLGDGTGDGGDVSITPGSTDTGTEGVVAINTPSGGTDFTYNTSEDRHLRATGTTGTLGVASVTTAQRNSMATATGLVVWNSDNAWLERYDGSAWNVIGAGGGGDLLDAIFGTSGSDEGDLVRDATFGWVLRANNIVTTASAPTAGDDVNDGYYAGSVWITTGGDYYYAEDSTDNGTTTWTQTNP